MRSAKEGRLGMISYIYRGLLIYLISMGLVFIGGTIFATLFRTNPTIPEEERQIISERTAEGQIFKGIGTIRVPTMDSHPGMVIISVSFVYHPEDKTFSEELVLRIGDFRDIVGGYIGSLSIAELQQSSEESIKVELLRRFNAILRLGKIETLYFGDFMIVG